jgi:hypothetical protein
MAVYEHALSVGDRALARALSRRLFPWSREHPLEVSRAAVRLVARLVSLLGL